MSGYALMLVCAVVGGLLGPRIGWPCRTHGVPRDERRFLNGVNGMIWALLTSLALSIGLHLTGAP